MKVLVAAALSVLLVMPVALPAQGAAATAREFLAAHAKQDWNGAVTLIDTSAFSLVRKEADDLLEQMSKTDAEVTSGDASRLGALRGMMDRMMGSLIGATFARVKTADELKQLGDRDLMMRWLEAKSARYQAGAVGDLLGGLAGGALPPGAQGRLDSMSAAVSGISVAWSTVGEVAEGATIAHVIYRTAGMTPPAATGALTFRQSGGRRRLYVSSLQDGDQLTVLGELEALALDAKMK